MIELILVDNEKWRDSMAKSTTEEYLENMSSAERANFDEELRKLALSEMVLAVREEDEVSVQRLATLAGISIKSVR